MIEGYGEHGDFGKEHLVNPHLFRLIGDIQGKRILDAGSGTGYLSRMLARNGANVTAVEPSTGFIHYCRERDHTDRLGITWKHMELGAMSYRDEFNVVVCSMVLMDIPDWKPALRKCVEALLPGGKLVLGLTHPCFEDDADTYRTAGHIVVSQYLDPYVIDQEIGFRIHRPLHAYLNAAIELGCQLTELVEPQLPPSVSERKDTKIPSYLILAFSRTEPTRGTS